MVALLKSGWPDWTFLRTGRLSNAASFDITEFVPCTPTFPPPFGQCGRNNGGVGALFSLEYYPGANDPSGSNVHWIQRVFADIGEGELDFIDVAPYQRNPYYDDGGAADEFSFRDAPWTPDFDRNNFFYAETYLVEEIAPRTVKIYNGIRWGWENKATPVRRAKKFSDSLSAGEVDTFNLKDLTPGTDFLAWIDNDHPENSCNPNTFLSDLNDYDDNSSFLGDGLASAFIGKVSPDGTIDLEVSSNGRRGEDRGNYDLYVQVYDPGESPDPELLGGSGGGGIVPLPRGRTQDDPILASEINGDWQIFRNVPSCRWYDPPTPYGFEFQALDDTLFTEIVNFPVGVDDLFSVAVEGTILGEFGPGQNLDFVELLGGRVSNLTITGIDALFGSTPETAFPIQLAFDRNRGSFQMRPFSKPTPKSVPEPTTILSLFAIAFLGWFGTK